MNLFLAFMISAQTFGFHVYMAKLMCELYS
jgi:hypothetical protein